MLFEEEFLTSNKFPDYGYDRNENNSSTENVWKENWDLSDNQKDFDSEASEEFCSSDSSDNTLCCTKKDTKDNNSPNRKSPWNSKELSLSKESIKEIAQNSIAKLTNTHPISYKTNAKRTRVEDIVATIKDRPLESLSDCSSCFSVSEINENDGCDGTSVATQGISSDEGETVIQSRQVSPNMEDNLFNNQTASNKKHPSSGDHKFDHKFPPKKRRCIYKLDNDLTSVSNSQQFMEPQCRCSDFENVFVDNKNYCNGVTFESFAKSLKNELLPKLECVIQHTVQSVIDEVKYHFSNQEISNLNVINEDKSERHLKKSYNVSQNISSANEEEHKPSLKSLAGKNGISLLRMTEADLMKDPSVSSWKKDGQNLGFLPDTLSEKQNLNSVSLPVLSQNKNYEFYRSKGTHELRGTFSPVKQNTSFLLPSSTTHDAFFQPKTSPKPYKSPPALLASYGFSNSLESKKMPITLQENIGSPSSKDFCFGVRTPQNCTSSLPSSRFSLFLPSLYATPPDSSLSKSDHQTYKEISFVDDQLPKFRPWYGQAQRQFDSVPLLPSPIRKRVPRNHLTNVDYSSYGMAYSNPQNLSCMMQSALTPLHLKKAKLMFFYTRYPTSNVIKTYFCDINAAEVEGHDTFFNCLSRIELQPVHRNKQTRSTNSQLVKWFSNFREFYYIQIEKHSRQALSDGVKEIDQLEVTRNSDLFRALNHHYNKDKSFDVPEEFLKVVLKSLQQFFLAIQSKKDRNPSWKKEIYKVICKLDTQIPEDFYSLKMFQT